MRKKRSYFGENIKKLQKLGNISRQDLAETLDISYSTLSNWIVNQSEPGWKTISKVSEFFGKSEDEMLSILIPVYAVDRNLEIIDYMAALPLSVPLGQYTDVRDCAYLSMGDGEYLLFNTDLPNNLAGVNRVVYVDKGEHVDNFGEDVLKVGEIVFVDNVPHLMTFDGLLDSLNVVPINSKEIKGVVEFSLVVENY